jgi:hypothetical protein
MDATQSWTFYLAKENPTATASSSPLSSQLLCAYDERTGLEYCDRDIDNEEF